MPFIPIMTQGGTPAQARPRVWLAQDGRVLLFALPRRLLDRLTWHAGDRIVVALGVGDDLGRAQLTRVARSRSGNAIMRSTGKACFLVRVTLPEEIAPGVPRVALLTRIASGPVEATIVDGALAVTFAAPDAAAPRPRIVATV